jgi:hypothetical protein
LGVWAGTCAGILIVVTARVWPGLGWWWLAVGPGLVVVSVFPGSVLLHLAAMTIEWVAISLFACPKCRGHRFSFGRTHGFGL